VEPTIIRRSALVQQLSVRKDIHTLLDGFQVVKNQLTFRKCNNYVKDHVNSKGAWLSERLRRWSNKQDVVGSIPVTTVFFLISCDSNQVPKWFGTHSNLEVPL